MADDMGMMQVVPESGESFGTTDEGVPGKLSFLSAGWINTRVFNVARRVDGYVDRLLDRGLLADGYAPWETPITDEMLMRLTPEQFRLLFDSTPTIEAKHVLLERMEDLKLPVSMLLPDLDIYEPPRSLAREPNRAVASSEALA